MTSAPIAQQRLLIDLQDLDSRLARLRHERKHLPVLARIESVIERLKANKRAAIQAAAAHEAALKDATIAQDRCKALEAELQGLRDELAKEADDRQAKEEEMKAREDANGDRDVDLATERGRLGMLEQKLKR